MTKFRILINICNLCDGNNIRIVKSWSNAVKTHKVLYSFKILIISLPVSKTLTKYKSNSMENDEGRDRADLYWNFK